MLETKGKYLLIKIIQGYNIKTHIKHKPQVKHIMTPNQGQNQAFNN